MINVNLDKSSSRAVYEYFTDKCKDIKTSNVSKNFNFYSLCLVMQQWLW